MMSRIRQFVAILFNANNSLYWTIFVMGFLMYANRLPNGYTFGDSTIATEENELIAKGISGIPEIFMEEGIGWFEFAPLAKASFAIEYALVGEYYLLSNYVQIILFGAVCSVFLLLISRLFPTSATTTRLVAVILFAAHPGNSHAVNSMTGRPELMSTLFFILGWVLLVKWLNEKRLKAMFFGTVFFLLALLSNSDIISWFVLPLISIPLLKPQTKIGFWPVLGAVVPAVLLYIFYRFSFVSYPTILTVYNPLAEDDLSSNSRYATAFYTVAMYMRMLIYPDSLVSAYGFGQIHLVDWQNPTALGGLIGSVLLVLMALVFRVRSPMLGFGLIILVLDIVPHANTVALRSTIFDEKILFGATFGFSIVLASVLAVVFRVSSTSSVKKTYNDKPLFALMILALVVLSGYRTYSRNYDWVNNYKLTTHDVELADNAVLNYQCGRYLRQEYLIYPVRRPAQHVDSAAFYLDRSIFLYDQWAEPHAELGRLELYERGRPEEALRLFERAMELDESKSDVKLEIGRCLISLGKTGEAISTFGELLEESPKNESAIEAIVGLYLIGNYLDEAEYANQRYFQLHPDSPKPFELQGRILLARGDSTRSIEYLEESIRREENNPELATLIDILRNGKPKTE